MHYIMKTEKKMLTFSGRREKRLPRGEETDVNFSTDEVPSITWMKKLPTQLL